MKSEYSGGGQNDNINDNSELFGKAPRVRRRTKTSKDKGNTQDGSTVTGRYLLTVMICCTS